jgi:hypothetical protein
MFFDTPTTTWFANAAAAPKKTAKAKGTAKKSKRAKAKTAKAAGTKSKRKIPKKKSSTKAR